MAVVLPPPQSTSAEEARDMASRVSVPSIHRTRAMTSRPEVEPGSTTSKRVDDDNVVDSDDEDDNDNDEEDTELPPPPSTWGLSLRRVGSLRIEAMPEKAATLLLLLLFILDPSLRNMGRAMAIFLLTD